MEYIILFFSSIWACSWISDKLKSKKEKDVQAPAVSQRADHPAATSANAKKDEAPARRAFQKKQNIPIDDIVLTEEFKQAFEMMENTNQCLYITGKAGTGKSTLLRYFRAKTKKNIAVLAPTGIAAINVGGQTIHAFLHLPPRYIQKNEIKLLGRSRNVVQKIEALIIDETSMVRADLMDGIDWALRLNRSSKEPFGGVQIIMIGDLYQLPPVVNDDLKEFFERIYKSPYFFSAKVFDEKKITQIELTHIFRQKDSQFISLLNNIRDSRHTEKDLELLNSRIDMSDDELGTHITLTPTNDAAARINARHLANIDEPAFTFRAIVKGEFKEGEYPNDYHLVLKKGAQVMMIKNDTEQKRWVNGSLGRISHISDKNVFVELDGGTHEILREVWEKVRYVYNEETDRVEPEVIGSFEQYPIRLAWAITIHKSQGQTFDDVVIDLGDGAFAHGQVYVALSRCTRFEGIKLRKKISFRDIKFDSRVRDFHKA